MKNFSSTPLLHSLSNIEIIKYLYYEPRFNGAYSRDNLPRVKRWCVLYKSRQQRK